MIGLLNPIGRDPKILQVFLSNFEKKCVTVKCPGMVALRRPGQGRCPNERINGDGKRLTLKTSKTRLYVGGY